MTKQGDAATSSSAGNQVVVYSPHGQELLDEFEALFEAANPGVDCVARFIPTGQILSTIRIDKDSPKIDIWWGGTSAFFTQAQKEGLLQPYEPSWSSAISPDYRDPDHHWYAQFLQVPAVMFNSAIHKPEDMPSTWETLLDEKWKDKIVIREPLDSGTMKTIYTGLIWRLSDAPKDPRPGYEFLRKLDARTKSYLPNPQALYDRIAKSSQGYISLWNVTDIIFQTEANKYPFGFRIPADPVPISLDPIGIIASAPNLANAKRFYEFVTSAESGKRLVEHHYRILARNDLGDEAAPKAMKGIQYSAMPIDLQLFDLLQTEWMDYRRRNIRDPGK